MAGVNKVILVGRLGQDPDVKYMPSGRALCKMSLATSESWKDKETGEKNEKTEWHKIILFDRLGEVAGEYLAKGSQVYIEGRLQTRKWQDKSGNDRWTTEIIAHQMQMLGGKGQMPQPAQQSSAAQYTQAKTGSAPAPEINDEIPF